MMKKFILHIVFLLNVVGAFAQNQIPLHMWEWADSEGYFVVTNPQGIPRYNTDLIYKDSLLQLGSVNNTNKIGKEDFYFNNTITAPNLIPQSYIEFTALDTITENASTINIITKGNDSNINMTSGDINILAGSARNSPGRAGAVTIQSGNTSSTAQAAPLVLRSGFQGINEKPFGNAIYLQAGNAGTSASGGHVVIQAGGATDVLSQGRRGGGSIIMKAGDRSSSEIFQERHVGDIILSLGRDYENTFRAGRFDLYGYNDGSVDSLRFLSIMPDEFFPETVFENSEVRFKEAEEVTTANFVYVPDDLDNEILKKLPIDSIGDSKWQNYNESGIFYDRYFLDSAEFSIQSAIERPTIRLHNTSGNNSNTFLEFSSTHNPHFIRFGRWSHGNILFAESDIGVLFQFHTVTGEFALNRGAIDIRGSQSSFIASKLGIGSGTNGTTYDLHVVGDSVLLGNYHFDISQTLTGKTDYATVLDSDGKIKLKSVDARMSTSLVGAGAEPLAVPSGNEFVQHNTTDDEMFFYIDGTWKRSAPRIVALQMEYDPYTADVDDSKLIRYNTVLPFGNWEIINIQYSINTNPGRTFNAFVADDSGINYVSTGVLFTPSTSVVIAKDLKTAPIDLTGERQLRLNVSYTASGSNVEGLFATVLLREIQ